MSVRVHIRRDTVCFNHRQLLPLWNGFNRVAALLIGGWT